MEKLVNSKLVSAPLKGIFMYIDLNDSANLTMNNVRNLIASGCDLTHSQLRVSNEGIAYLSKDIDPGERDDVAFRLDVWQAGNEHVGLKASEDTKWVTRIYDCLKTNWPKPTSSFIDHF